MLISSLHRKEAIEIQQVFVCEALALCISIQIWAGLPLPHNELGMCTAT